MRSFVGLLVVSIAFSALAQRKPLDHDVYDKWETIKASALSSDGKWLVYVVGPYEGDTKMYVKSTDGTTTYTVDRGSSPQFAGAAGAVVFTIQPPFAEVKKAQKEKRKPEDMPKSAMGIMSLQTGQLSTVDAVRSWRLASKGGECVAYQPEPEKPATAPPAQPAVAQAAAEPKPPHETKQEPRKPQKKKDHAVGSKWIIRNIASGKETPLDDVSTLTWSEDGAMLIYSTSTKDGAGDGVFAYWPSSGEMQAILVGMGRYTQITIHNDTKQVAFITDRDDYEAEQPTHAVYVWTPNVKSAMLVAKAGSEGIPEGWTPVNRGNVSFSKQGGRLFFPTAPKPELAATNGTPPEEQVVLDIWNWKDPLIQPMQLRQAQSERNRTFQTMAELQTGRIMQLETPDIPSVAVGSEGEADFATGTTTLPYGLYVSFDKTYSDVYLINLRDVTRKLVLKKHDGFAGLSPESKYLLWYSETEAVWYSMDVVSGSTVAVSKGIPYPVHNELNDVPAYPGSYGMAGWTKGDARLLLYDRYDIWSVDPGGKADALCETSGFGRRWGIRFRAIRLEREERSFSAGAALLLSAFDERTKDAGFYRIVLGANRSPHELLCEAKYFSTPTKAEKADVIMYTRQDFHEFPNIWISDTSFSVKRKMSDVNPGNNGYSWGTSELVTWVSSNGETLQGVVYKPEEFQYSKQYPMIVYFYERLSDNLHRYYSPGPTSSSISISFYVSRGYVVFTPDIPYTVGYPGQSAMHAIIPGVQALIARGFVDPKRIGLQGHSWGGYQIAYMITQTRMFACAEAGAPVSNMISAYGGIRWESGMSRQFQYEKTQSRIGGSIWERPLQFVENSPVFWADKVQTPLLILHNDQDGAVPWYQGIELYMALRRLNKPVWMLNYNGEGHGISKRQNQKDFAIRMQQFFDHYLKGAPMPKWMSEGIPAVMKGKTLGLETPETKAGGD